MEKGNSIGGTPNQYLEANPYSEINESKIIEKYVLEMISETVYNIYIK